MKVGLGIRLRLTLAWGSSLEVVEADLEIFYGWLNKGLSSKCFKALEPPKDGRTKEPEDQRTKGPEDQGSRGPRDQRTKGPKDQGTRGPRDQGTKGPGDQGTRGPRFENCIKRPKHCTSAGKMTILV